MFESLKEAREFLFRKWFKYLRSSVIPKKWCKRPQMSRQYSNQFQFLDSPAMAALQEKVFYQIRKWDEAGSPKEGRFVVISRAEARELGVPRGFLPWLDDKHGNWRFGIALGHIMGVWVIARDEYKPGS